MAAGAIADCGGRGADPVALSAIPERLAAHPAFAPYRGLLGADGRQVPGRTTSTQMAAVAGGAYRNHSEPPRLIPPPPRALGALDFERRIVERNELIVRPDNLHDTVNALVWHRFPRSKHAISAAHVALGAAATANGRPRRRDILTLFDEAGALVISERADLRELHEQHAWRPLFVERRTEFVRDCRVILFGHGTLEQLASNPHRGLTVKALWLPLPPETAIDDIDRALATGISKGQRLAADERRLPLPLLGVPGWFAENEAPVCYDDVEVFRPLRRQRLQAETTAASR